MHDAMTESVFHMLHHLAFYADEGLLCYAVTILRKLLHSPRTASRVKMQAVVDQLHAHNAHSFFKSVFR